jgi:hypothetical protein
LPDADDKKSTIIVSARGEMSNIRTAMNRGGIRLCAPSSGRSRALHGSLSRYLSPRIASRLRWWKLPPDVSSALLNE